MFSQKAGNITRLLSSMASKILPVLLPCTLLFLLQFHFSAGQNVVKAAYWFSGSGYPVSDIDATLFTHLFCAFADLDPQTNQVTISSDNQAQFRTFTSTLQQKNPSIKTLLSIGGGNSTIKAYFASMASQASSRKSFIDSSISLARSYGFHGLDIDWEYPENSAQMANFGTLLNEWRAAVATEATNSGRAALLLSAAVTYSSNYFGVINPVQAISNSLDWINVMAYDFYYYDADSKRITGPPAALYSPGSQISGDVGIRAWIEAGMPAKKIVLGFPFYGHSLQLTNPNNHGFWAPTTGDGDSGLPSYKQIKEFITENGATKVFNATVVSDYCYSGTTWIGYDDTQSISTKVNYAKEKGLLGYFAWQISQDDNWALSRLASQTWG